MSAPFLSPPWLSPVPSFASLACFHLTRLFFVSIVDSTRQYRRSLVHRASCPFGLRGWGWAAGGYRLCAMRWRFSWLFLDSLQSEVTIFSGSNKIIKNYVKCMISNIVVWTNFCFLVNQTKVGQSIFGSKFLESFKWMTLKTNCEYLVVCLFRIGDLHSSVYQRNPLKTGFKSQLP